MADLSRSEIQDMSREERIQEELRRAAEYGMSPKRSVLLDPTLSKEVSTPTQFSAGSTLPPTPQEARQNDFDVKITVTDLRMVPDHARPLIFRDSPQALHDSIRRNLDALTPRNRDQILPVIVEKLRDLQIQDGDIELVNQLQQQIVRAVWGTGEFEDDHGEAGGGMSPRT